jgi:hypothetical protein
MGQHNNEEHNRHMEEAAKHDTYKGHDGKANAPLPFNALSPVGQPDIEETGEPGAQEGKKDAPQPFRAQHGKEFGPKDVTRLSKGKTG